MLLTGLVTQAAESKDGLVLPSIVEELADSGLEGVRWILGCIGHLIHYGGDPEATRLQVLFNQIVAAVRRVNRHPPDGPLPGDVVELLVDGPERHLEAGMRMRALYVVGTKTILVGHESISDDYVLYTLPYGDMRKVGTTLAGAPVLRLVDPAGSDE
jgi:hypothetical protein